MKISRTGFYICVFLCLSFYVAGFVYVSMFAYSYENDVNVDFVVFTIEHYLAVFLVIMILPFMCGLFIVGLGSPYWTFEQEDEIFCFVTIGGFLYVVIIGILFLYTTNKDNYITKEQRDIIVDLIRQEKISKRSVKASSNIKIDKNAYIGHKPLELCVCFEKGFHSPICTRVFENFLIKEKEEVRREKAREYLAEKNKIESIENYNRIVEKVK